MEVDDNYSGHVVVSNVDDLGGVPVVESRGFRSSHGAYAALD